MGVCQGTVCGKKDGKDENNKKNNTNGGQNADANGNSPKIVEGDTIKEINKREENDKKLSHVDHNKNRKARKKNLDLAGIVGEDEEIFETFKPDKDKKMVYSDVAFIIKSLKNHFFFTNLTEDELEKVISKMFYASVNENDYVFKQGDKASCYFIIDKGTVNVEINGSKKRVLASGCGFGDLALLYNSPRSASIKCETMSFFWVIDRKTFRNVVEEISTKKFEENRNF